MQPSWFSILGDLNFKSTLRPVASAYCLIKRNCPLRKGISKRLLHKIALRNCLLIRLKADATSLKVKGEHFYKLSFWKFPVLNFNSCHHIWFLLKKSLLDLAARCCPKVINFKVMEGISNDFQNNNNDECSALAFSCNFLFWSVGQYNWLALLQWLKILYYYHRTAID